MSGAPVVSRLGKRTDGAIQSVRELNESAPLSEDEHDFEAVADDPLQAFPGAAEYARLPLAEKRALGRLPHVWMFENEANRKLWLAYRWTPLLGRIVQGACAVACVCAVLAVAVIYTRPAPLTLLSFPDGRLSCGPVSVDPRTQVANHRQAHEERLCAQFAPPPPRGDERPIEIPGWGGMPDAPLSEKPVSRVSASLIEAVAPVATPSETDMELPGSPAPESTGAPTPPSTDVQELGLDVPPAPMPMPGEEG